jgi:GNAT superfamily N-acetyltransferase
MLAVRRLAAGDVPALAAIVSSLPEYFTEDVAGQVERDCAIHPGWVLAGAAGITGFAVAARRSPGAAEILWIAVGPAWRGAGTMLLDHLLGDLAAEGVSVVEAKTLDRSAGYRARTTPVRHGRPVKDQRSRGRGVLAGSRGGQSLRLPIAGHRGHPTASGGGRY